MPQTICIADLLAPEEWARLPEPLKRRFGRDFRSGTTTCYRGQTLHTHLTLAGRLLAQIARCIGAPLPLHDDAELATVVVTDHPGTGGQVWTRLYHTATGVPQVIQSVKRLNKKTGLEEYLGFGLSMALKLSVDDGALVFTGRDYYFGVGPIRWRLPRWLKPGTLTVRNWQDGDTHFRFGLTLDHPWLGRLIEQEVSFDDRATSTALITGSPTCPAYATRTAIGD